MKTRCRSTGQRTTCGRQFFFHLYVASSNKNVSGVEVTLMFMACAVIKDHNDVCGPVVDVLVYKLLDEVHGPCCQQKLTVKGKGASFAVVLMTADSQLRMRDIEGFHDNLSPPRTTPPKTFYTGSYCRELVKTDRDAGVSLHS
ncbi:hypothetical protein STEG23_020814 [Scotinomys teguina]